MAYTSEQLNALEQAIALGVTTVKYKDREQTFRSLKEMRSLREDMKRELGVSTPNPQRGRRLASFSKGIS